MSTNKKRRQNSQKTFAIKRRKSAGSTYEPTDPNKGKPKIVTVKDDLKQDFSSTTAPSSHTTNKTNTRKLTKVGKYIAIDCEMVGVGFEGQRSALARVSIVNYNGVVIYDKYVRPMERITDFRTEISGITSKLLIDAHEFKQAQQEVAELIKGKIVVGHALHHDFKALLLDHPRMMTRDTSIYRTFRTKYARGKPPSLKKLAQEELGLTIQENKHSSVEDAKICMLLFRKHKREWEQSIFTKTYKVAKKSKSTKEKHTISVRNNNKDRS
ncbi:6114_t:CDS:2 [Paraglomus brasilianum]|uniref:RNA exonuclease 4 n=1 Tax=Paraglomus brasilianum TaxID=144538 RepID=A0A9N9DXB9_9GLOM|nr:6114_t:CDS:2 [Paraglomus brasilianum]